MHQDIFNTLTHPNPDIPRPSMGLAYVPTLGVVSVVSMYLNLCHTLHVCHISLHWGGFGGQCRHICHTWSVWETNQTPRPSGPLAPIESGHCRGQALGNWHGRPWAGSDQGYPGLDGATRWTKPILTDESSIEGQRKSTYQLILESHCCSSIAEC